MGAFAHKYIHLEFDYYEFVSHPSHWISIVMSGLETLCSLKSLSYMLILRLHCRSKGRIDFCDASDLRTVVFSHTVAPHQPGTLTRYSASESILLYVDDSRGDVWCLDLFPLPLQSLAQTSSSHNKKKEFHTCVA